MGPFTLPFGVAHYCTHQWLPGAEDRNNTNAKREVRRDMVQAHNLFLGVLSLVTSLSAAASVFLSQLPAVLVSVP
jgi:hypothetical protein